MIGMGIIFSPIFAQVALTRASVQCSKALSANSDLVRAPVDNSWKSLTIPKVAVTPAVAIGAGMLEKFVAVYTAAPRMPPLITPFAPSIDISFQSFLSKSRIFFFSAWSVKDKPASTAPSRAAETPVALRPSFKVALQLSSACRFCFLYSQSSFVHSLSIVFETEPA